MFTSHDIRFPEEGWRFRAMKPGDVPDALDIIAMCDEDDREWAESTYQNKGLSGHFVAVKDKQVWGVTGYGTSDGTVGTGWLSWTYLHPQQKGRGIGSAMLTCLFEKMESKGYRKIFVSLSDYTEPDGTAPYADAMKLYKKAGFHVEIQHSDFYAKGESQFLMGRMLEPKKPLLIPSPTEKFISANMCFYDALLIDETEDSYFVDWGWSEEREDTLTVEEIQRKVSEWTAEKNIRSLFISIPDDHLFIAKTLTDGGFATAGRLKDFFQTGVGELQMRMTFG